MPDDEAEWLATMATKTTASTSQPSFIVIANSCTRVRACEATDRPDGAAANTTLPTRLLRVGTGSHSNRTKKCRRCSNRKAQKNVAEFFFHMCVRYRYTCTSPALIYHEFLSASHTHHYRYAMTILLQKFHN